MIEGQKSSLVMRYFKDEMPNVQLEVIFAKTGKMATDMKGEELTVKGE